MATPVRAMSSRAIQAEQTRRQIMETATRMFVERGYEATTIQMIADEMGLTKAAVYYHFHAKIDILQAALRPGITRIGALLDEAALMRARRARIEHVVSGLVDFLVENRHYAVMASSDLTARRQTLEEDTQSVVLRARALTLIFGEQPSATERLSFYAAFSTADHLPELVDLSDEELREALQSTMLRILRVPAS